MKAEHVNPFIASTMNVFATLLSCELARGELCVKSDLQPSHDVTGIIGLSGKAIGTVALSLDRAVALGAAEALLCERHEDIDADVVDAIGELTNIIAGAAKGQLEQFEMSVSIPSVIVGKNHRVQFPSNATPICVPFHSNWGTLCLEVSLVERPEVIAGPAHAAAMAKNA